MNKKMDITGVILKTDRLLLRPWLPTDVEDLYAYARVPGVGEMAGWPHHKSIEESKKILCQFIEEKKTFALVHGGRVIGSLGIELYAENELPKFEEQAGREIGYVLSKAYWGRGLMPEAVKEVIRYLFEDEKLDFLVCGHFPDNRQSWRVQQKCGFRHYKKILYQTQCGRQQESWLSLLRRTDWENEK